MKGVKILVERKACPILIIISANSHFNKKMSGVNNGEPSPIPYE
jgi:hypothetical protein